MKIKKVWERHGRREFLKIIGFGCGMLILSLLIHPISFSFAKDIYPAQKITLIVHQNPGGGYDMISRGVAPFLTKYLREVSPGAKGGGIVIRNESAAGGMKAFNTIFNAKPDGYTIGTFDTAFATETLRTKMDFDLNKFTFLLQFNTTTRLLVCKMNTFENWEAMLKFAKTKELKWGSGQFGLAIHVDSIIIRETTGIPARFIPTGGAAANISSLLRGDTHVAIISGDSAKPLIDAGEIKILADFSGTSEYPGVPSSKDLGYPSLADKVGGHRFFIAPPGLPKDVNNILVKAFKKVLNDPDFLAWTKKSQIPLQPVFGNEADQMAKKMFKLYQQDMKAILVRNLE